VASPSVRAQNVVINEIMFHASTHNPRHQFVELFNAGTTNVDLSGWRFTKGLTFTIPGNTVLRASNYLVVAAEQQGFTNRYPGVTNYVAGYLVVRTTNVAGFTYTNYESTLSHSRETIEIENAAGQVIDSVFFAEEGDWGVRQRQAPDLGYQGWTWFNPADGLGRSLELMNPRLPNDFGLNWSPGSLSNGTPGAANSVFTTNTAPIITSGAHSPIVPRSTDPVAVTARVIDESTNPVVRLFWRTNITSPTAFVSAAMFDDGAHGDGTPGDGYFGALLPATPHGTIIEFYVEAVDAANKTNSWPRPAVDVNGTTSLGHAANALYCVDNNAPTNSAPYYRLVMTRSESNTFHALLGGTTSPDSDAAYNCTFISQDGRGTQVRYLCAVRNRGHGSRNVVPHNYHLKFPSDSAWQNVRALQLNAISPHVQHLGAIAALNAGVAGNWSRAVQIRFNGGVGPGGTPAFTYYAANESPNSDFAENHFPHDPGGNIYAVFRDINPPDMVWRGSNSSAYTNTYFKSSNTAENDFRDIVALHRIFATNDLYTTNNVRAVINVEQWLAHLAMMAIYNNQETGLNVGYNDDYQMYRGINDPRFMLMYHDLDSIMSGSTAATIFGSTANNGVGPTMNRFLHHPVFEQLYYQTLQRMLTTSLSKSSFDSIAELTLGWYVPTGTIAGYKAWMDARRNNILSLCTSYFATNPLPVVATIAGEPRSPTTQGTARLTVAGTGVTAYRFRLNDGAWSAETNVAAAIALSGLAPGSTNVVAVIGKNSGGLWQGSNAPTLSKVWIVSTSIPPVRINEVLADNRTTHSRGGTYPDMIELYNEGAAAVDIGGFRISDDASDPSRFVFPSPTVIAAGGYLVLYANNPDATGGIHLGFALDADGEGVFLYDSAGALIDSVVFGNQVPDYSLGRFANNGDWKMCVPTFGFTNFTIVTGSRTAVRINEWLASGVPPYAEDFVELFNTSGAPVDIGGCFLTDNPSVLPTRYQFPALTFLPAKGFLSLLADGGDGRGHLPFRFSSVQEQIALLDPAGVYLDGVTYGPQVPGVSQGRCADGASFFAALVAPTPGAPNACGTSGGLVINEVMASNNSRYEPDGTAPDWIELFNNSTNAIDLGDYSLGDSLGESRRFVFPAGTVIQTQTFLRVFFDTDRPASATNTGFRLKSNGDSVFLFNSVAGGGGMLDYVAFGVQAADFTIGRVPNGSTNWLLCVPTPVAANIVAALGDPADLKINEWLANPDSGDDAFEVFNPSPLPVSLGDLWLTDDLGTPASRMKHRIARLSFIGTNDHAFQKFIADGVLENGPEHVSFSLGAGGEALGISQTNGTLIDGIVFGAQLSGVSEGRFPDGAAGVTGFPFSGSLGDRNWLPLTNVVINEVLTHSDAPLEDAIELLNTNAAPVNLSGWFLSDSKSNPRKFKITNSLVLAPGAFTVFYETQFNNTALAPLNFSLDSAHGDDLVLAAATNDILTGYRVQVGFDAAANGVAFGRYRTSDGATPLVAMGARTFGADSPATVAQFRTGTGLANAYPLVGPVVIAEIHYHPPDLGTNDNARDEFIRLFNAGNTNVALHDPAWPTNTWRLRGAVSFDLPGGLILAPGASLVLVGFDPVGDPAAAAAFRAAHGISNNVPLHGPWSGKLDNSSDTAQLLRPDAPQLPPAPDAGFVPFILVEKVKYSDDPPWPLAADGAGQSLHRVSHTGYANDVTNWIAAAPTPGFSGGGNPDTDGDGMPDAWEITHSLDPNSPADAGQDADGDDLTNFQEFLAGTNPRDAASVLRAGISAVSSTARQLRFDAVSNLGYSVQYRTSLATGGWLNLATIPAAPSNRVVRLTNSAPDPARFYRVTTP
jgi:hypothetical protein